MLNSGNALRPSPDTAVCGQEREEFLRFFSPLAQIRKQYAAEIASPACRRADRHRLRFSGSSVQNAFVRAMQAGPESGQAREAVADMRRFLGNYFFPCDEEMLWLIYELYFENGRQVDEIVPGLAVFVSDAVFCYIGGGCPQH